MRAARGLTLVEILTATVLMAILVAACVPILRRASQALDEPDRPIAILQLATLADGFLADPDAFGPESAGTEDSFEIQWPPANTDRPSVLVQRLEPADPADGRRWLVFSCDGASVVRWLPAPEPGDRD